MKSRIALALQLAGTGLGVACIATHVDLASAKDSLARIPIGALALAAVLVGAERGGRRAAVARAAGCVRCVARIPRTAEARPALPDRVLLQQLPASGAVTGDVARGVVTRDAFASLRARPGALAVVLGRACARPVRAVRAAGRRSVGIAASTLDTHAPGCGCGPASASPARSRSSSRSPAARRLAPYLLEVTWPRSPTGSPQLRDGRAFAVAVALSVATPGVVVAPSPAGCCSPRLALHLRRRLAAGGAARRRHGIPADHRRRRRGARGGLRRAVRPAVPHADQRRARRLASRCGSRTLTVGAVGGGVQLLRRGGDVR